MAVKIQQGSGDQFSRAFLFPWTYAFHYFPHKYGFLLVPFGLYRLLKGNLFHPFSFFTIWAVIHLTLYFFVMKVPTDYPWYYGYSTLAYLLLMSIGLPLFIKWLLSLSKEIVFSTPKQLSKNLLTWKTELLYVGFFFLLFIGWTFEVKEYHNGCPWIYSYSPTDYPSRIVGQWLKQNTKDDAVITASDIGAFGYYSEKYIYDLANLVHNHLTRTRPPGDFLVLRIYDDWNGIIPDNVRKHDFTFFKEFQYPTFPTIIIFSKNDIFQNNQHQPINSEN